MGAEVIVLHSKFSLFLTNSISTTNNISRTKSCPHLIRKPHTTLARILPSKDTRASRHDRVVTKKPPSCGFFWPGGSELGVCSLPAFRPATGCLVPTKGGGGKAHLSADRIVSRPRPTPTRPRLRPRGVVAKHTYPQIGLYHDQDQHQ